MPHHNGTYKIQNHSMKYEIKYLSSSLNRVDMHCPPLPKLLYHILQVELLSYHYPKLAGAFGKAVSCFVHWQVIWIPCCWTIYDVLLRDTSSQPFLSLHMLWHFRRPKQGQTDGSFPGEQWMVACLRCLQLLPFDCFTEHFLWRTNYKVIMNASIASFPVIYNI